MKGIIEQLKREVDELLTGITASPKTMVFLTTLSFASIGAMFLTDSEGIRFFGGVVILTVFGATGRIRFTASSRRAKVFWSAYWLHWAMEFVEFIPSLRSPASSVALLCGMVMIWAFNDDDDYDDGIKRLADQMEDEDDSLELGSTTTSFSMVEQEKELVGTSRK